MSYILDRRTLRCKHEWGHYEVNINIDNYCPSDIICKKIKEELMRGNDLLINSEQRIGIWTTSMTYSKKEEKNMENSNFNVSLNSYGKKRQNTHYCLSSVSINCEHFSTFKSIVEAITPILEKEEKEFNDCECSKK